MEGNRFLAGILIAEITRYEIASGFASLFPLRGRTCRLTERCRIAAEEDGRRCISGSEISATCTASAVARRSGIVKQKRRHKWRDKWAQRMREREREREGKLTVARYVRWKQQRALN